MLTITFTGKEKHSYEQKNARFAEWKYRLRIGNLRLTQYCSFYTTKFIKEQFSFN